MSIFNVGGIPRKVPQDKIISGMFQDRYFLPGIIHGGEDYLIRVYLNDSHCENAETGDHDQFEINYISKNLILEAAKLDPTLGSEFYQHLFMGDSFGCSNDGKTGEFAEIVEAWPESRRMTNSELVEWAKNTYSQEEQTKEYRVQYEEVLVHEFYVDAKNPHEVIDQFNRLADECALDFSDGDLVSGQITKYISPEGKETFVNDSYADIEHKAEYPTKIEIPLGDGFTLVADKNEDPDYKEIFVYLRRDKDNCIYQDLAIIGERYSYIDDDENPVAPIHGGYSVKVYSDPDSEDFIQDYEINRHVEPPLAVCNIEWETDDDEDLILPNFVNLEKDMDDDDIADYLSDKYGFLVKSFEIIR